MGILLEGLFAFLALSFVILVHELGHFLVARRLGVWVEEFGLGLPPRIWGKKIGETVYSLNAIPLGGFVRLHGEVSPEEITDPKRAFLSKSKKVRAAIALAGVTMNFIVGAAAFGIFYTFEGIPQEVATGKVRVLEVVAGSPAQSGGVIVEDVIAVIDGKEVKTTSEFISEVDAKKGRTVRLEVERTTPSGLEIQKLTIRLKDVPAKEGALGVVISSTDIDYYYPPLWQRPFVGAYYGLKQSVVLGQRIIMALVGIAGDVARAEVPKGIVGPAGLLGILIFVARQGLLSIINFIGLISVNLAIMNLIPFPPLDGSRVALLGLEGILKRKLSPRIESTVHTIGMAILIILMILITSREIPRLISSGSINNFVESLFR